jgi:predicted membrane metal-binding protein
VVLARTVAARYPRVKASSFWYNTGVAPPTRTRPLRLESRPGRMPAIDAAGFLFGAVLLVAARLIPQLISLLAFWLLLAALACGFGVDLFLWFHRGVHAIELDGDMLTLRRGRSRTVQRMERTLVRSVRSRRTWGGQKIVIKLRQPQVRGVVHRLHNAKDQLLSYLLRRDRVVLRDDVFDRETFASLAEQLTCWNRRGG